MNETKINNNLEESKINKNLEESKINKEPKTNNNLEEPKINNNEQSISNNKNSDFVKTPEFLKSKRAIQNPRNNDDKSFQYSITLSSYHSHSTFSSGIMSSLNKVFTLLKVLTFVLIYWSS